MRDKIDEETVTEEIVQLLVGQQRVKCSKIQPSSLISTDLGVDGDDAKELLEAIEERFSVQLLDILQDRFWPEAGLFFDSTKRPISVSELAKAVTSRVLDT